MCGQDSITYISACHAGCTSQIEFDNGTTHFSNCTCISGEGTATSGGCPVDCRPKLIMFLIFLCINKFMGGSEGAANFLIGVRCVDKKDKAIAFGLSSAILSLLGVAPSATFFGWIIDKTCILWGKSCSKSGTGNCWLYDTDIMKYSVNFTAGGLIFIGTLFDIGTWYYSKDVEIFDKEDDEEDNDEIKKESNLNK